MAIPNLRHAVALALLCASSAAIAGAAPQLVISEFRVRGPNGANDEFVQIQNVGTSNHTVAASSGAGYGVAASDGIVRFTIPNGTVIPAGGSYLGVNSVGFSLASYPAGNGTTATGDATYTSNIADNAGIALFTTSVPADFSLATRLDAVGSTSEANALYKEGAGYPALTPFSIDYAFHRDQCGKDGSITTFGACPAGGAVTDSNDNASDFVFVDTNGTSAGAGQRLGGPGPQNLSSPITGTTANLGVAPLDDCVAPSAPPVRVRDATSDPANNSTFGTLDLRYTFTNNTGSNLTRLRFRVIDLTTFPAPSGIADLRPRTSTAVIVTVDRTPCMAGTSNVTVQGTTLEQPPAQPNGGGFNSSLSVGAVSLATPLAPGASIDVRFLLGIQQTGTFRIGLVPEGLPAVAFADDVLLVEGCTNADCGPPSVQSIVRAGANPRAAGNVDFTVTFTEPVTGVNVADFSLNTTGTIAGASISGVAGTGATRTVTVATGSGSGTVRLDVVDNDSIVEANIPNTPLGGVGPGNGNYNTGEAYTIDGTAPGVTIAQALGQADPTNVLPIRFAVTFSEPVTGFTAADVVLGGTAAGAVATVSGGPAAYEVAINGLTSNGTVTVSVPAAAAIDAVGNPNTASTTADATVTYGGIDVTPPTYTVALSPGQPAPLQTSPVRFTVTFNEPVTGFTASDVVLGGSALPTSAVVSGGPTVYEVAVSGMSAAGTITVSLAPGSVSDLAGNPIGTPLPSASVVFGGGFGAVAVPALDATTKLALLLAMFAFGAHAMRVHRRRGL